jgi:Zn-dependent protease with chaperone function
MVYPQEEVDARIRRLEPFAKSRPQRCLTYAAMVAALGYATIAASIVVGAALLAGSILTLRYPNIWTGSLAVGSLLVLVSLIKALWIEFPTPKGLRLEPGQTPELQLSICQIRTKLGGPRIQDIYLTRDYNAAIVQNPRFGIFGGQRNYLVLGVSMLCALPPEEFQGILAHEFGHLAGNHGRFSGWLYRARQTWVGVSNNLATAAGSRRGSGLIRLVVLLWARAGERFLRWYIPLLDSYAYIVSRMHEVSADRAAAGLVGATVHSRALTRMKLRGRFLAERFWAPVWQSAKLQPVPDPGMFLKMSAAIRAEIPVSDTREFFVRALLEQTQPRDTHPCFYERLVAVGNSIPRPLGDAPLPDIAVTAAQSFEVSAAQTLLGERYKAALEFCESNWSKETGENWKKVFSEAVTARARLAEMEQLAQVRDLTEPEALARAESIRALRDPASTRAAFESLLARFPANARANYVLGFYLLDAHDAAGLELLDRAMNSDVHLTPTACDAARRFCMEAGNSAAAERYARRREKYAAEVRLAQAERVGIGGRDELLPHRISSQGIAWLRPIFQKYPLLESVHIAQKRVVHFPDSPYFVIGLVPRRKWYRWASARKERALVGMAKDLRLPGQGWVVLLDNRHSWLKKKLRQIPGSQIYP